MSKLRFIVCTLFLILAALLLSSPAAGPPMVAHFRDMSPGVNMLASASHVFVGVIGKHTFELSVPVVVPADKGPASYWKVLRRKVLVETVLLGEESRKAVDVYEIFWTGGTSGDWNNTQDGDRVLLPLRVERGQYRVIRDWWRSIYPITTGPHARLPGSATLPFWERVALMNWWVENSDDSARIGHPFFRYLDPAQALDFWRVIKLERGLLRHPSTAIRIAACRELLQLGSWGLDECWDTLTAEDRPHLRDGGHTCCVESDIATNRARRDSIEPAVLWSRYRYRDERRLLTTINQPRLRAEFCRLYSAEYPGDTDNGCPANQPPPATIVTESGDVPLMGPWPR